MTGEAGEAQKQIAIQVNFNVPVVASVYSLIWVIHTSATLGENLIKFTERETV